MARLRGPAQRGLNLVDHVSQRQLQIGIRLVRQARHIDGAQHFPGRRVEQRARRTGEPLPPLVLVVGPVDDGGGTARQSETDAVGPGGSDGQVHAGELRRAEEGEVTGLRQQGADAQDAVALRLGGLGGGLVGARVLGGVVGVAATAGGQHQGGTGQYSGRAPGACRADQFVLRRRESARPTVAAGNALSRRNLASSPPPGLHLGAN